MATIKLKYHDELKENFQLYEMFEDFTKGFNKDVKKYLVKYATEKPDTLAARKAFASREERLYNINSCDPYLTIHLGHLSQPVDIKLPEGQDDEFLQSILADATQYGETFKEVFRDLLWYYLRDGKVGLLVDKEPMPENLTEAQAKSYNLRSYQVLYEATQIRNYEHHHSGALKGKLKFVDLCAGYEEENDSTFEIVTRFELAETAKSYIVKKLKSTKKASEVSLTDEVEFTQVGGDIPGALPEIPFILFGTGAEDSFISSIVELNKATLNDRSVKGNINYHQGFKKTYVTGAKPEEVKKTGESIITALQNENANVLSIDAGEPTGIENQIKDIENNINRRGKIENNQLADDTKQVQSADSKTKDVLAKMKVYDYILDYFEMRLKKAFQFHCLFDVGLTFDITNISVSIARDYNLEDTQAETAEDLATFSMARELQATLVMKMILKKRVQNLKIIPDAELTKEETLQALIEDIDNAESAQPQSGIGDLFGSINNQTTNVTQ